MSSNGHPQTSWDTACAALSLGRLSCELTGDRGAHLLHQISRHPFARGSLQRLSDAIAHALAGDGPPMPTTPTLDDLHVQVGALTNAMAQHRDALTEHLHGEPQRTVGLLALRWLIDEALEAAGAVPTPITPRSPAAS